MTILAKYRGLASLVLLVVVAPILVWQYAVGGTVRQHRATGRYREQIALLRGTQTADSKQSDATFSEKEMILGGDIVGALLPAIEKGGLKIEHYSPCVTSEADGVRLSTGVLTVRGGFAGIVGLLDTIERELPHCKIVSAHYKSTRPRNRNERKTLSCTIYVQQITVDK